MVDDYLIAPSIAATQDPRPVIYTTVLGGSDRLRPPVHEIGQNQSVRWIRFVDQGTTANYQGWENILVPCPVKEARRQSRAYKLQPQVLFPTAPWSVWMDATHQWREDPVPIVEAIITKHALATFGHTHMAEQEYEDLCKRFPEDAERFAEQRRAYEQAGWSYSSKLRVGTIVVRKHTPAQAEFDRLWAAETARYGDRDQIPLTYLLWKCRYTSGDMPGHPFFHPWFRYTHHRGDRGTCYPHIWGPFPRNLKRAFRKTLPIEQQRNWLERRIEAYLARWHGRGDTHQYEYYRCLGCRRIVTWRQISRGGCDCQLSNKLVPANVRWWELARMLVAPWSY